MKCQLPAVNAAAVFAPLEESRVRYRAHTSVTHDLVKSSTNPSSWQHSREHARRRGVRAFRRLVHAFRRLVRAFRRPEHPFQVRSAVEFSTCAVVSKTCATVTGHTSRSSDDPGRPSDDTSRPSDDMSRPSDDMSRPSDDMYNRHRSNEQPANRDERNAKCNDRPCVPV